MTGWLIGILGNLVGDSITGSFVYLTRHIWMPHAVAFHQKHLALHRARMTSGDQAEKH